MSRPARRVDTWFTHSSVQHTSLPPYHFPLLTFSLLHSAHTDNTSSPSHVKRHPPLTADSACMVLLPCACTNQTLPTITLPDSLASIPLIDMTHDSMECEECEWWRAPMLYRVSRRAVVNTAPSNSHRYGGFRYPLADFVHFLAVFLSTEQFSGLWSLQLLSHVSEAAETFQAPPPHHGSGGSVGGSYWRHGRKKIFAGLESVFSLFLWSRTHRYPTSSNFTFTCTHVTHRPAIDHSHLSCTIFEFPISFSGGSL